MHDSLFRVKEKKKSGALDAFASHNNWIFLQEVSGAFLMMWLICGCCSLSRALEEFQVASLCYLLGWTPQDSKVPTITIHRAGMTSLFCSSIFFEINAWCWHGSETQSLQTKFITINHTCSKTKLILKQQENYNLYGSLWVCKTQITWNSNKWSNTILKIGLKSLTKLKACLTLKKKKMKSDTPALVGNFCHQSQLGCIIMSLITGEQNWLSELAVQKGFYSGLSDIGWISNMKFSKSLGRFIQIYCIE